MNINRWCGSGRLVNDIDIAVDPGGEVEGEFKIACNGRDRKGEYVSYVHAVIQGDYANRIQDELVQGRFVVIEGELRTRGMKLSEDRFMNFTYVLVQKINWDPKASPLRQPGPVNQSQN